MVTSIPGTEGEKGDPGINGSDGVNAFTTTTASFECPAVGDSVTVSVASSAAFTVGQNVFVETAGYFSVASKPAATSFSLTYLDYVGNVNEGNTISSGAQVSPAGTQGDITDPLPIANGGTGAATKSSAQNLLGLGASAIPDEADGLNYDITNAYASIGLDVIATNAGRYLVLASLTALYTGTTFASSRTLSIRIRNVTQSTNVLETTRVTNITTTTGYPSIDYVVPPISLHLAANDNLQIQVFLDTVESAGSSKITAGGLTLVPLALD